ncbi:hypothetical protein BDZ85DRAFT_266356 [Elsinoe ampelina]|uniref:Uncharacterized protein n=1 Tax=Elsinoe ampelina TaxID=302913 RepID=A0A6A6G696_9PEZI|nr:hypothetical protein BDZ85DRAFT_266356 [Elsinoe ampelina]
MADRLTTPLSSLKLSTATPVSDSWEDDSPSDHETTSPPSPSQAKTYPRAPPPTPATTSPTVPSTDWGAASSKYRTIDGALDEREEDSYMASRAAKPSGRKDSAREREKEKEKEDGARKWQEYSSSSGGDPRSGPSMPTSRAGDGASDKRPEKSTAVASRLIAAGLGVKAPRRTEEQREYDKAMRAQEAKKREREREEERRRKEESERAKRAIWDD